MDRSVPSASDLLGHQRELRHVTQPHQNVPVMEHQNAPPQQPWQPTPVPQQGPKDFYQILGVPRDATPAEIKSAYFTKAKHFHPDKGGTTSDFQDVAEAFQTLSDPNYKTLVGDAKLYDALNLFASFDEVTAKGADIVKLVDITKGEALTGCNKDVTFLRSDQPETVTVPVPKKAQTGQRVRVHGKGRDHVDDRKPAGDFVAVLDVVE